MYGTCHCTPMRTVGFEDLVERRANLGVLNAAFIEEEPFEDGVIEAAACCVVRPAVELTDISE